MKIKNLYPGSYYSNCYLVVSGSHGIVIDPSAPTPRILAAMREEACTLDGIYLTHGHFDHIESLDSLRAATGAPAFLHQADSTFPSDSIANAYAVFFHTPRVWKDADFTLQGGEEISLGETRFRVLHTPGHTGGSVCFLFSDDRVLFTGDTLFAESYGRCDLRGGSAAMMRTSLHTLADLSETEEAGKTIRIYPGHGNDALLANALDNAYYYS